MMMSIFQNPLCMCQFSWLHTFIFFLLFINFTAATFYDRRAPAVSYSSTECASIVPEASPTTDPGFFIRDLLPSITYYTGGDIFFGHNSSESLGEFLKCGPFQSVLATNIEGVFKIEAYLTFANDMYDISSDSSDEASYCTMSCPVKFKLHGFWSESSGRGCMVGSAYWYSSKGGSAMLKFSYPKNSTISTSLVRGNLESLESINDESYFEPISVLAFPELNQYEYTLVSEEIVQGNPGGTEISQSWMLSLDICDMFRGRSTVFKLEYARKCKSLQNCFPLNGDVGCMPPFISLYGTQCSELGDKLRVLIKFTNTSYVYNDKLSDPNTTLVGEGFWDASRSQLSVVACRILNSTDSLSNAYIGDCSIRLSLCYPALWTIRNITKSKGQIWTNKTATDAGYFDKIEFTNYDESFLRSPAVRYEYTEINRVRRLCPKMTVKKGERYPNVHSYDMSLNMLVGTSKKQIGWGYADPIFIGHEWYNHYPKWEDTQVPSNVTFNITYKLKLTPIDSSTRGFGSSRLDLSLNSFGVIEITAEGVYDAGTGYLCMVGCRYVDPYSVISANDSLDCEILVNVQLGRSKGKNRGFTKGSIKSLRTNSHPLFFEPLYVTSYSYSTADAEHSIWRIDLEITMVLISNTLACVFVWFQLNHVKRYSNVLPFISVFMIVILTLGHMIPLVANFEALFLGSRNLQYILQGSSGWLEVNEVIVVVVKTVALLLQFWLLQLAWTSRSGTSKEIGVWVAEKKVFLVSVPLYILGGFIWLAVNRTKSNYRNNLNLSSHAFSYQEQAQNSLLGDLRLYIGLIVDGFLFPQILLNIFQMSSESSLSPPFYLGTTAIRVVPHFYDLYRGYNNVPAHVNGTHIYANPSADIYSVAWDVIIPAVGLLLAGIIYLQQKYGCRCILPSRCRELKLYSEVPVVST